MDQRSFPVIALVSSAGGLAATTEVLSALPSDLPAAVLVLQHISPDHVSHLAGILGKSSSLPVRPVRERESLSPGCVHVAPPGYHTLVSSDRTLVLIESGSFPPPRPSADLLLTTLALAVGADAYAVILSGAGNDGATGATAVHHRGGIVLTTDEATSFNFSMPGSAIDRDSIVDAVVPLPALAEHLAQMVTATPLA